MKFFKLLVTASLLNLGSVVTAFAASPDVYVVNFRNAQDSNSARLDGQLASAIAISGVNAEEVVIDTSTAAKWEKGAHEAFSRDIVPVFNQWVGLPGFAAIVDAKTKRVIGCVNSAFSANEMAEKIRQMASKASGSAYLSRASYDFAPAYNGPENEKYKHIVYVNNLTTKTTRCPAAHNVDPGR